MADDLHDALGKAKGSDVDSVAFATALKSLNDVVNGEVPADLAVACEVLQVCVRSPPSELLSTQLSLRDVQTAEEGSQYLRNVVAGLRTASYLAPAIAGLLDQQQKHGHRTPKPTASLVVVEPPTGGDVWDVDTSSDWLMDVVGSLAQEEMPVSWADQQSSEASLSLLQRLAESTSTRSEIARCAENLKRKCT
jgi:hypothetical protein